MKSDQFDGKSCILEKIKIKSYFSKVTEWKKYIQNPIKYHKNYLHIEAQAEDHT